MNSTALPKKSSSIGEAQIKQFIVSHSSKYSRRDFDASSRDYADPFLLDGRQTTRDAIIKAHRNSWSVADRVTEVALEPVRVSRLDDGRFAASYIARRIFEKAGRKNVVKDAAWEMVLSASDQGVQIVSQTFVNPESSRREPR